MTEIENIHRHIEKLVIASPEVTTLIARYQELYQSDDKVLTNLLQTLAELDTFFVGLDLGEFKKALDTYKMPLTR